MNIELSDNFSVLIISIISLVISSIALGWNIYRDCIN